MSANLCEGLVEIGAWAFQVCTSLHEILIPPTVKRIQDMAFKGCPQLTSVILGEGLNEIGEGAFRECKSLHEIRILPAVRGVKGWAFHGCSSLTSVVLNDETEEFVTAASMQYWWNHGTHHFCPSTYCFLVQSSFPSVWISFE